MNELRFYSYLHIPDLIYEWIQYIMALLHLLQATMRAGDVSFKDKLGWKIGICLRSVL